ncbi:methyl-accepting chemotaxis protein [Brevibacillus dissolubilis]|uniref:methyl-accepting chemotaxis protein n=1 Tax=Brevibacillus dissolubilis TaxID=1844116 RepID=UPI00159BBBEA|nr:methyl-accepting chemotaxis protein [Brevibacillus dissolubilis]
MLRHLQLSVKTKLIVACTILFLLPSLSIAGISYYISKERVQDEILQGARQTVVLVDQLVTSLISPKIKEINELVEEAAENDLDQSRLESIKRYQQNHSEVSNVYIVYPDGRLIQAGDHPKPDSYEGTKQKWYEQAVERRTVVMSEPYKDEQSGNQQITIAKTDMSNRFVMAIDLNLDHLSEPISRLQVGREGYVMLVDKERNFLVHPTETGKKMTGDAAEQVYSGISGEFSYQLEGKAKMLFFATNSLTNWKIMGTMYEEEADKSAQPILTASWIVLGVLFLYAMVQNYFVIRSIVVPLGKLNDTTKLVAQGDLTKRVESKSRDEIGQLAGSFNQMADSLQAVLMNINDKSTQLAASSEEMIASAEQSSMASEQITTTIQEVASGSETQVRSMQQTADTMGDMSVGVQQIASNARSVSSNAMEALQKTEEGNQAIHTAISQMQSVNKTVRELERIVKGLGERSQQIGAIVGAITDISNQTNLLALNAAIEAARAGEHGRGFAVVADEVRKLAEQSTQSAAKITELITTIQQETSQAVRSMEAGTEEVAEGIKAVQTAGDSFGQISFAVSDVTTQIQEVTTAVQQLAVGAEDVVVVIRQIEAVSETNSSVLQNISASTEEQLATMEEITVSASVLAQMAEDLQQLISRFQLK